MGNFPYPTSTTPRIALSAWRAAGEFFDYRGHAIFARDEGKQDASALLLIHGFPTSSWDWEALWPILTQRFHVYTLDLIGFGYSAKPRNYAYSILDQADLIEAYLRKKGVSSVHVLAHDYGVSVAQELLARQTHADRNSGLTLQSVTFLNGGLFPETHRPALIQKLLLSPLGFWIAKVTTRARLAQNMVRIFGANTKPDAALIDDFWALISANNGRAIMHKLIRYMPERKTHRSRWVSAMQQTHVPLKLICGAADPISGAHMAARYQELVPQANVSLLDNIGHYPQVEAPGAVIAAFLQFQDSL